MVEIRIDELVLHGADSGDPARLRNALEQELTILLADGTMPPGLMQGGELGGVNGDALEVQAGNTPEAIGAQLAKTIHRGGRR